MKALRHDAVSIVAYSALAVGALGLGFLSFGRFDVLLSAPLGSLMVFSRVVSSLAATACLYGVVQSWNDPQLDYAPVRQ
jgi:hypothetical protein